MHLLYKTIFCSDVCRILKNFSDIIHTIIEKTAIFIIQYNLHTSIDVLTNMYFLLHVEVYFSTNQILLE